MKNYALYLLIYNLLGLFICSTDWVREKVTFDTYYWGVVTTERANVINFIDTPFYIFGLIVLIYYNVKLSKMQRTYFFTSAFYLSFKWLNPDVGYYMFFVWNYVIIIGFPVVVYLESRINYDRFNK